MDEVLSKIKFDQDALVESIEGLLKLYKWIWGQEDANYPYGGKNRDMSIKSILELKEQIRMKIQANEGD